MTRLRAIGRWLDDLTGASAALGPILRHPVPPGRRFSWMYVFGSATLTVFLVQVVTGTALATAYVTGSGDAYDSLRFITDAPVGRLARGMHDFGASAMVTLVGIHAIRVYLTGAYKYPRQVTWLTGAGLLLFTLLMAFTGQLLRWDQTGFWTAVVAAEQAGRTPVIGDWLGHFILAGDTAGGATLSRFFATHVFFIPALIFPFIAFHLYLVLRNGISEVPRAGERVDPATYRTWYHDLLRREGVPFWPDAAWRDVVFAVAIVAVLFALALIVGPPELGKPPDPTILDASPRPDWYFLWYFAVLTMIPRWIEDFVIFFGPLLFGLALILLPLVAPRGERSAKRRVWAIGIVVLIITIIAAFGRLGDVAPWSPRLNAEPLPVATVGAASGPVAEGARTFHDKGCEFCHRVAGQGGIRGPDLTLIAERLSCAEIRTRLLAGAADMPAYAKILTPDQERAILVFMGSRHRASSPGTTDARCRP